MSRPITDSHGEVAAEEVGGFNVAGAIQAGTVAADQQIGRGRVAGTWQVKGGRLGTTHSS